MKKTPSHIAASVRARLLNIAKARGDDFQFLLTQYANERILYRLTHSVHGTQFVLKGAALFTIWTGKPHRATRDVDLLGIGDPSAERIHSVFDDVLAVNVDDDGVTFDQNSLEVRSIREDQIYGGIRATAVAHIASAKVRLQIDVGFGDAITPEAKEIDFPALLDFPGPRMRAYPPETVVAEKIEAMVQLGLNNSRMKDFYDLKALSRMFEFDGEVLVRAVRATFERRGTPLPTSLPVALTPTFFEDATKKGQWTAFIRKSGVQDAEDLRKTAATIASFIAMPLETAATDGRFLSRWRPRASWAPT